MVSLGAVVVAPNTSGSSKPRAFMWSFALKPPNTMLGQIIHGLELNICAKMGFREQKPVDSSPHGSKGIPAQIPTLFLSDTMRLLTGHLLHGLTLNP